MPQYLVAVYNGPDARRRTPAEMEPIIAAVGAINTEAQSDGTFVFAGGLHDQTATTTIDPRSGTPVLSDGPYIETKEYLGGFWIIDVPDLDAALAWSQRAAVACQEVLEVRPFMDGPPQDA